MVNKLKQSSLPDLNNAKRVQSSIQQHWMAAEAEKRRHYTEVAGEHFTNLDPARAAEIIRDLERCLGNPLSAVLTPKQRKGLERLAISTGVPLTKHLRDAISGLIKKHSR